MRSNNISRDQIEERETKKGRFYFVEITGEVNKRGLAGDHRNIFKKIRMAQKYALGEQFI